MAIVTQVFGNARLCGVLGLLIGFFVLLEALDLATANADTMFCLLPSWPARCVLELAPAPWRRTAEQPDVQRRLDSDIFRRATLAPGSVAA